MGRHLPLSVHAGSRTCARLQKGRTGTAKNRIFSAIRARRFPGKKFSAEFAVDMAVELRFAPEIEWDVLEAYSWYEITDDETLA